MMKFVHALNAVVAYIRMEKLGNVQTVTTHREPFCSYAYLSISTDTPDFNSTVQWSGQTVICLSQRFTRASSNSVRSAVCALMKSCKSVM